MSHGQRAQRGKSAVVVAALWVALAPVAACGSADEASPITTLATPVGDAADGSVAPDARADGSVAPDARADGAADAASPPRDAASSDGAPVDGGGAADASLLDADALDAALLDAGLPTGPRYDEAVYAATHNSYSGGARGSIVAQLDAGVRFIELDFHDTDFAQYRDYRIGHDKVGNQVELQAPNPTTPNLRAWLDTIAAWSVAHPGHGPITLGLDVKSDLTDNASFADGNLAALNADLEGAFGARLFPSRDRAALTAWPRVDALRGRVLAVLSGDETTRRAYAFDVGRAVSIAMNAAGQVVEIHASAKGELWYWTGAFDATGAVRFRRHGRIGKGTAPAVALTDSGVLVEIHQGASQALAYRVGALDGDLEITWQAEASFGRGTAPSVRSVAGASGAVRAIWVAESGGQTVAQLGAVTTTPLPKVTWSTQGAGAAQPTTDPRFDVAHDSDTGSARWVSVRTGVDGLAPSDTLLYATGAVTTGRVRYDALAFLEHQKGGDALLEQEAYFHAASADEKAWLAAARTAGRVVRAWELTSASQGSTPPANFPATDTPAAAWYTAYSAGLGAVR